MQRLTFDGYFCDFSMSEGRFEGENCPYAKCYVRDLWNRLKAIEDVLGEEYTIPDDIGKLIIPPVDIGDTVWMYRPRWTGHSGVRPFRISNIIISAKESGELIKQYKASMLLNGEETNLLVYFNFADIGRTVFKSRIEAELNRKDE